MGRPTEPELIARLSGSQLSEAAQQALATWGEAEKVLSAAKRAAYIARINYYRAANRERDAQAGNDSVTGSSTVALPAETG